MASLDVYHTIRIALIGKTGVGKSSLGNTILGTERFNTSIGGESDTLTCTCAEAKLPSGVSVKVVDTPGIMDTRGNEQAVRNEVTKAIGYLSPGPHAFLIVLTPGRTTKEEKQVLHELRGLFGDSKFLKHTIIVMVRKDELKRNGQPIEIHDYIKNYSTKDTQDLYKECGERIIAVDNSDNCSNKEKRKTYASEIIREIAKLGGDCFSHELFELMRELQIKDVELARSKSEVRRLEGEIKKKSSCTIL